MQNLNISNTVINKDTTSNFIPGNRQFFIRFKNIPKNEISGVYDGDCGKIRDELGTSCYQFIKNGKNYNIILSSISIGFLYDLCYFLNQFEDGKIPAYLIEAEQVGLGSYGEPVVKNINIIKKIKRIERRYHTI